jgi:hypothetical protein
VHLPAAMHSGGMGRDSDRDVVFDVEMARRFRTAAWIPQAQDADIRRVAAYERGAEEIESLSESAAAIYQAMDWLV